MAQIVVRLDDELLKDVDVLVAEDAVASRSEAVRLGLSRLVDLHRRQQVGLQIVEGYQRVPQTADELAGLHDAARALIAEESW